jgi:hypothetical protein
MLQLLRVFVLIFFAGVLVNAAIRISTGTTGSIEKSVVAAAACVWMMAAWRELRDRGLRRLKGHPQ